MAPGLCLPAPAPSEEGVATGLFDAALGAAGLAAGLWVAAPPLPWVVLLGHRHPRSGSRQQIEEADRPIAEAALRVCNGLLERLQA